MKKPLILYADIENIPCVGWFWRSGKQVVDSKQILEPGRIICISYLWSDEKIAHTITWDREQNDKDMLSKFSIIAEKADAVIGHKPLGFDVKHINTRLAYHGLPPLNWQTLDDTYRLCKGAFNLPSFKLDYVCQYFGLGEKVRTGGFDLWKDVWLKKDQKALKQMTTYCEGDVYLAKALYEKIQPYVKTKMNYSRFTGNEESCPYCGGELANHGYRNTTKGRYQRKKCGTCFKQCTAGKNLLEGASRYPK